MMNLFFTTASVFLFAIIAMILGILSLGPEKDSAVCRGQN